MSENTKLEYAVTDEQAARFEEVHSMKRAIADVMNELLRKRAAINRDETDIWKEIAAAHGLDLQKDILVYDSEKKTVRQEEKTSA